MVVADQEIKCISLIAVCGKQRLNIFVGALCKVWQRDTGWVMWVGWRSKTRSNDLYGAQKLPRTYYECYGTGWDLHRLLIAYYSLFIHLISNSRRKSGSAQDLDTDITTLLPVITLDYTEIKNQTMYTKCKQTSATSAGAKQLSFHCELYTVWRQIWWPIKVTISYFPVSSFSSVILQTIINKMPTHYMCLIKFIGQGK